MKVFCYDTVKIVYILLLTKNYTDKLLIYLEGIGVNFSNLKHNKIYNLYFFFEITARIPRTFVNKGR